MTYEDKPSPGRGFLLFICVLCGGCLLLLVPAYIHKAGVDPLEAMIVTILLASVVTLVFSWVLILAYKTVYTMDSDTLKLRSGFIYKQIRLNRIHGLRRAPTWREWLNPPVLGRQAFCNRFSNYVCLELKGEVVLLTPTDPEKFIAVIKERQLQIPGTSSEINRDSIDG